MTRKRKIGYAFLCGLITLVLGLSVGEIYVRWFLPIDEDGRYELVDDPILFYQLKPEVHGVDLGAPYTHTSQAIRGPHVFESEPRPGVDRVLWIGDSACYGVRVRDEDTAPSQFHGMAGAEGRVVESINLGVVGYNVRQVREVLVRRGKEFRGARAVVYYHHENDIINATWVAVAPHVPAGLREDFERPQSGWVQMAKRSALVHRLGRTQLVGSLLGVPPPGPPETMIRDAQSTKEINALSKLCLSLYRDDQRLGRQFRDELHAIADTARGMKARLIVVIWPTPTVRGRPEFDHARAELRDWCRSREIELVDVTSEFATDPDPGLYVDMSHPGVRGHSIVATEVWKQYENPRNTESE